MSILFKSLVWHNRQRFGGEPKKQHKFLKGNKKNPDLCTWCGRTDVAKDSEGTVIHV